MTEAILVRLDSPVLAAGMSGADSPDEAEIRSAIASDKEQLEVLATAWGERRISTDEWRAARQPIDRRLEEAVGRLRAADRHAGLRALSLDASPIRHRWPSMPLERRHSVLCALLDHLIVNPAVRGGAFDGGRLVPVWRA